MKKLYLTLLSAVFALSWCIIPIHEASAKKIPKNGWKKKASITCRSNVVTCSDQITEEGNEEQTNACVSCCTGSSVFDEGKKCLNYCTCECSLKSNPTGKNTKKLCKRKRKKKRN